MAAAAAAFSEDRSGPADRKREAAPVELERVLEQWRAEAELEEALGDLDAGLEWVSLAEAEEAAGVSRSTLRAWYRGGHIPSRLVPGPHGVQRMVPKEIVVERAERSPGVGRRNRSGSPGASAQDDQPAAGSAGDQEGATVAESMLKLAQMACEQAEARAAAAEARAEAAEARAADAEAKLREAIERAAAAEARLDS